METRWGMGSGGGWKSDRGWKIDRSANLGSAREIGPRSRIVYTPAGPEIHIRAVRQWWPLLFLPVWLAGWTVGGVMALREFIRKPDPFLGFWLLGWLMGEVVATAFWSWMMFGEEVVSVGQGTLRIARRMGPWGLGRGYPANECTHLRVTAPMALPAGGRLFLSPSVSGAIAVDWRARTLRFGQGLEEAEARLVAKEIEPYVQAAEPAP